MADETDNMEMEDILSSIKGILEEDEAKQKDAALEQSGNDVLQEVVGTDAPVENILELSPEMRIADEPAAAPQPQDEQTESMIESVLSEPTVEPLEDMVVEQEPALEEPVAAALSEEPESEPAAAEPDPFEEIKNEMADSKMPELTIGTEDTESDSIFDDDFSSSFDSKPVEPIEDLIVEPEAAPLEPEVEPAPEPVIEAPIEPEPMSEPEPEIVVEPEPVVEQQPEPAPEPEPVVEAPVEPEPKPAANPMDVSANIISNFAKMFSREEKPAAPQEPAAPAITALGDGAKTLEEFVSDAIVRAIGKEISRQWNDGADFKSLAEAEIMRQTKEWINDNLPLLVEKVVKQEIERVIAKVGS